MKNFAEYTYKETKLLLATVIYRLMFEIETIHDLLCHPILAVVRVVVL